MSYKYVLSQYDYDGSPKESWIQSESAVGIQTLKPVTILTYKEQEDSILGANYDYTYENTFKDIALELIPISTDSSNTTTKFFIPNQTYYCRCAIKKIPYTKENSTTSKSQVYTVKLVRLDDEFVEENGGPAKKIKENELQQYVKTITVSNPLKDSGIDEWEIVDFVFTPNQGEFNALVFIMSRGYYDYATSSSDYDNDQGAVTGRIPYIVFLECSRVIDLKTVQEDGKNILHTGKYKKIGVQSTPSFRMVINNEEIYTGRTGVYELKNQNVSIGSFSVVTPAQKWIFKGIEKSYNEILEELSHFQESLTEAEYNTTKSPCYYIIKENGNKYVNDDDENRYSYYNQAQNKRTFPYFTLDYIYELSSET